MQLSYDLRYDNVPAEGFKKTDTTLMASLVLRMKNKDKAPATAE